VFSKNIYPESQESKSQPLKSIEQTPQPDVHCMQFPECNENPS
jgi:hypothetical protein